MKPANSLETRRGFLAKGSAFLGLYQVAVKEVILNVSF